MSLEGLLTLREPLGPIDQSHIKLDQAETILNTQVAPFNEAISRAPILLLGRKGSGKSSILAEFRILNATHSAQANSPDSPPEPGEPFVISMLQWERFHELTRHVANQLRADNPEFDTQTVLPEYLAQLWEEAIWDEVFKYFYNFCYHRPSRSRLAPVEKYVLGYDGSRDPSQVAAERLYSEAKDAVLAYAVLRRSKIILLFDSMEKYPVRNVIFAEVLGGLLRAINNVHYESPVINVTFCLPEEIETHLQAGSSNILKDYSASYRIRWKPIDLLAVAAHRYRLFAELNGQQLYAETKDLNFRTREGIHSFFRLVMPATFENSLGDPEDPLAYIMRHTQLLPRHAIAVFNSIISKSNDTTGQFTKLTALAIREGVADAEKLIAQQVLVPYLRIYPELIAACEDVLPSLSPICSFTDLRKVERRFKGRIEEDIASVWRVLFGMGVLGRVNHVTREGTPTFVRSTRYCLAQFHYNIDGAFGLSDKTEYCFHPIFSKHFGMTRKGAEDRKTIYPDNTDMICLT